jgi:hypothetical protein
MSVGSDIAEAVSNVGEWLWGLIQGNFNEQQSISQLLVDAVIGMIPVVGDVTAVRDLIATIIKLVEHPEKREETMEWVALVIGVFALIPVAGGVIKGVGRLLMRVGRDTAEHPQIFRAIIDLINRFGHGNAVAWFRSLDLNAYTGQITAKFNEMVTRIDGVIVGVKRRFRWVLPTSMVHRLDTVREAIADLRARGASMIPSAIRELAGRLAALQRHIINGEWEAIPSSLRSTTREREARLVETIRGGDRTFTAATMPFPPTTIAQYRHARGWPDLRTYNFDAIGSFSGPITPRYLRPGTRIRRVIEPAPPNKNAGLYWMHDADFPATGEAWRKDFAVLQRWSGNGVYVEYVVPPPGLRVWEGRIASQIDNQAGPLHGQQLAGGATQLLIDFNQPGLDAMRTAVTAAPQQRTHWTGLNDIGLPDRVGTTLPLGAAEVAGKDGASHTLHTAPPGSRTTP